MAPRGRIALAPVIREFRAADTAAVVAIVRQLQAHESRFFDRMIPPGQFDSKYIDRIQADVGKAGGVILVAEVDGELTGYATLLLHQSSEGERDEILYTFSKVGDLAVTESCRNRGVGRALIAECERRARAAGQKWLQLGVLAGNQGARRFYREVGFGELGLTLEKHLT